MVVNKKFLSKLAPFIGFVVLGLQRIYLFDISQWREDQATTYWLGETVNLSELSVGLISSTGVPNPNGLILVGKFLSVFSNFRISIYIFSLLQLIVLYFFIKKLDFTGSKNFHYILFFALGSSPYLVMSSFELWSQYLFLTINLIIFIVFFLKEKNTINFLTLLLFIFLLPSLYLAGLMNLITLIVVLFLLFIFKKISFKISDKLLINVSLVLMSFFLVKFTWIPYFSSIELESIFGIAKENNININFLNIFKKIFFGYYFQEPFLLHADLAFYSRTSLRMRTLGIIFHFLLSMYFCLVFVISILFYKSDKLKKLNYKNYLIIIFILISYIISPIIGGPNFFDNERADINLQFYPLYVAFIYTFSSKLFPIPIIGNIFKKINFVSIFVLLTINFLTLTYKYQDYVNYEGELLTYSDVPMIYKEKVIQLIYEDYINKNKTENIQIYYDVGGDAFDWINGFGNNLASYYESPYTLGRVFDLIFYKNYGITNSQEGVQFRSYESSDYIITYKYNSKIDYSKLQKIEKIIDVNRFRILFLEN